VTFSALPKDRKIPPFENKMQTEGNILVSKSSKNITKENLYQ
jgi:hypothetical protein